MAQNLCSRLISLESQQTLYDFYSFTFVKYVLWPKTLAISVNVPSRLMVLLSSTMSTGFSSARSISERYVEFSNYNSENSYFSLQFYQFVPHAVWCSIVKCIDVKSCYVFLENWLLYRHVIPSLSLKSILSFKSARSKINIVNPAFFWLVLA